MILIRAERAEDYPAVYEVNRLAFGGEYEPRLVEKLRLSPAFIAELSLVAEEDGQIVGHILFSLVQLNTGEKLIPLLSLAPMAVLPMYQNQGTGSRLVREGLERCAQTSYPAVVVLGHTHFYPRFGFTPAIEKGIQNPFSAPAEAYMVYELHPHALEGLAGMVNYPPEFDE